MISTLLLTALIGLSRASEAPSRVSEVKIESEWAGLGDRWKESFTLTPAAGGYRGSGYVVTEPFMGRSRTSAKPLPQVFLPEADLQALVSSFGAPRLDIDAAIDRIASPEWLAASAPSQLAKFTRRYDEGTPCSPRTAELFTQNFQSPEQARKAMHAYFTGFWTDDYPSAHVKVTFADGRTLEAESSSQKYEMLPWKIAEETSWNSAIPVAIAKMLPEGSKLRSRLGENKESLVETYSMYAMIPVENELEQVEGRCHHRDLVARIERQYHVVSLTTSYGMFGAYLDRPDFPPNLRIYMVVSTKSPAETQKQLRYFETKMDKYLALAVPYAKAHPSQSLELEFYLEASLSDFDIDVRADRNDAPMLRKIADDVAVLGTPKSSTEYWALLPDGKVLHWDIDSN